MAIRDPLRQAMEQEQLMKLKVEIEALPVQKQEDVLRILMKNKACVVNEIAEGCVVNLTYAPEGTIKELREYVGMA